MKKYIFFLLLAISFLFMFSVVHAAGTSANEVVSLDNPLGKDNTDLRIILGKAVNKVLGVLGAVALLVFVVGGAMWLTSGGNAEKVKNGSMAMLWAIIGLFIIFSSYAILNLVIKGLFVKDTGTSILPANEKSPVFLKTECLCTVNGLKQEKMLDPKYNNEDSCLDASNTIDSLNRELTDCEWATYE